MIENYLIYLNTISKEEQIEQIVIILVFFLILLIICVFFTLLKFKFIHKKA